MVMFGLLLSLGMLIDGAIVVVEHANTKVSEGISFKKAYSDSVGQIAVPDIASTGTTLAAFLPLLFWPGVSGDFMSYLPIATVFAVLGWSLLYALVFVPTLGTVLGRRRGKNKKLPEDRESEKSTSIISTARKSVFKNFKAVVNAPVKFAGIMFHFLYLVYLLFTSNLILGRILRLLKVNME